MSRNDRRAFLGASAALLLAPRWLRGAFAADRCSPHQLEGLAALSVAYRRAFATHRRLLVFVIPADRGDRYTRGGALGEWLNHGSDVQLAPLADLDVACARMPDLRKLVPAAGEGEPFFVLVDPMSHPVTARRADVVLAPARYTEEEIDVRIEAVSRALVGLTGAGDPARAEEIRARIVKPPIPGAHWANHGGCGEYIEDVPRERQGGWACGMGTVPERSRRFVYMFSSLREQLDIDD